MKFALVLLSFLFSITLFAQDDEKEPTQKSLDYHDSRFKLTTPPYSLDKIKSFIKTIKYAEKEGEDFEGEEKLDDKKYQSLSLREKFTYNMIHPESYSQNCDGFPPVYGEQKSIFGYLPDAFGEYHWSE